MGNRSRKNRPRRPPPEPNPSRPLTRAHANSIDNLRELLTEHLPDTRGQYSWNSTQVPSASTSFSQINIVGISDTLFGETTSNRVLPSITHVTASITRPRIPVTCTITRPTEEEMSPPVTIDPDEFLNPITKTVTSSMITSTVSSTETEPMLVTATETRPNLTWPTTQISLTIPDSPSFLSRPSSPTRAESSSVETPSLSAVETSEIERSSPTFESSSSMQPEPSSLIPSPIVAPTYIESQLFIIAQPSLRLWQPLPIAVQPTLNAAIITPAVAQLTRAITRTTSTATQPTATVSSTLTSLNEYVYPQASYKSKAPHLTLRLNNTPEDSNNEQEDDDPSERETISRRVCWSPNALPDTTNGFLRFMVKRNENRTVAPIVRRSRMSRQTTSALPKTSNSNVYDYTEEPSETFVGKIKRSYGFSRNRKKSFSTSVKDNIPSKSVGNQSHTVEETRTEAKSLLGSPEESQPGPSGLCAVRRRLDDADDEPPLKISRTANEDTSDDSLLEVLRLDASDQIKISEMANDIKVLLENIDVLQTANRLIDANGINYKDVLEEAKRDKSSYFQNFE